MQPYYSDESVTLYHGDCRDVLPTLCDDSASLVLTDPPYASETHEGARSNRGGVVGGTNVLDFGATDVDAIRTVLAEAGRVASRWTVATMDWRHVVSLENRPPEGLRFVRFGVWVKPDAMPQISGDRPSQGWEAIAFMHRLGGRMRWNGGGRSSAFVCGVQRGGVHPTQKPSSLVGELVRLCSDPGDVILDPYMGSGTTLRAAKDSGRKAIGIELEERYCEIAVRRLAQEVLPLDAA